MIQDNEDMLEFMREDFQEKKKKAQNKVALRNEMI